MREFTVKQICGPGPVCIMMPLDIRVPLDFGILTTSDPVKVR